jgi:hypothetical protein
MTKKHLELWEDTRFDATGAPIKSELCVSGMWLVLELRSKSWVLYCTNFNINALPIAEKCRLEEAKVWSLRLLRAGLLSRAQEFMQSAVKNMKIEETLRQMTGEP